jgi:hypothetical protein
VLLAKTLSLTTFEQAPIAIGTFGVIALAISAASTCQFLPMCAAEVVVIRSGWAGKAMEVKSVLFFVFNGDA